MKRIVLFFILFVAFQSTVFAQSPLTNKIDELANAYAKQNEFSGAVLVAKGGQVIFKKGYGMADYSASIPNTPTTKFRIGSVTKQFTAAAVLKLEESGKLSVTDRLSKYIPDYPQGDKITIHNLLTHTSGIPNFTSFDEFDSLKNRPATYESIIGLFKMKPLDFQPGEEFHYSNSGYFLLSYIIEKASDMTYADYMRENIFKPLGMANTGVETGMEIPAGNAFGYEADGDGGLQRNDAYNMFIPAGAGAMYSTVEDLYIWERSLTTEKLLKKATLDKMFTPFKDNYAYGWAVSPVGAKRKVINHSGGIDGFSSLINRLPDDDIAVITIANRMNEAAAKINHDIVKILFNEPYELPVERKIIKVAPDVLKKYVGEYQLAPTFSITISTENGKLFGQATGQPKFELFPESDTKFFLKVVNAQVSFAKDAAGNVTELTLHQNGMNMPGKKMK